MAIESFKNTANCCISKFSSLKFSFFGKSRELPITVKLVEISTVIEKGLLGSLLAHSVNTNNRALTIHHTLISFLILTNSGGFPITAELVEISTVIEKRLPDSLLAYNTRYVC